MIKAGLSDFTDVVLHRQFAIHGRAPAMFGIGVVVPIIKGRHLDKCKVSVKCFKISMHQMRVKFFQSFNSIYARSSHSTEPVIQHLVNANCKPHLLYGSEVTAWNSNELSNIAYAFNSAMCRIYNVSLKLLPTVYYYTGQSDISHDIVHRFVLIQNICYHLT